jgi:hypothetical protein
MSCYGKTYVQVNGAVFYREDIDNLNKLCFLACLKEKLEVGLVTGCWIKYHTNDELEKIKKILAGYIRRAVPNKIRFKIKDNRKIAEKKLYE